MSADLVLAVDYDDTTIAGNMIDLILDDVGIDRIGFWARVNNTEVRKPQSYLHHLINELNAQAPGFRTEDLARVALNATPFPGAVTLFPRLREFASSSGMTLYVICITAGLEEMVVSGPVGPYLDGCIGSTVCTDWSGKLLEPGRLVTPEEKANFLVGLSEGRSLCSIPTVGLESVIYVGDGFTDVPAMTQVTRGGGTAIAVYAPHDRTRFGKAHQLFRQGAATELAPADYGASTHASLILEQAITRASRNRIAQSTTPIATYRKR